METQDKLLSIPNDEQETTISITRTGKAAIIWTSDRTMLTKLDRLCRDASENYVCHDVARTADGQIMSKEYTLKDKSLLSFRTRKTELTDEQRAARAARFRQSRAVQNGI